MEEGIWVILAMGSRPDLLETLSKISHPAYKNWMDKGYPRGNAGVVIYGRRGEFRIEPYTQHG